MTTGPIFELDKDLWDRIKENLDKDNVPSAAHKLRREAECFFENVCDFLNANVPYKGHHQWELGDFAPAAIGAYKSYLKKAKEIIVKSQVEQWAINANVHYNKWGDFSKQYCKGYTRSFLPEGFTFDPSWELPITSGRIHFIRLVNEKGYITILNEEFYINKALSFEYVWAILNTRKKELIVYYQGAPEAPKQLIRSESYKLREPVKNRIPINEFC